MELQDLKVGQTVLHNKGFTGTIEKIKDNNISIKISDKGYSTQVVGDTYVALPKYILKIINSDSTENSTIKVTFDKGFTFEGSVNDFETFYKTIEKVIK